MKKILILLTLSSFLQINYGQEFTFHSNSPFNIQITRNDGSKPSQKLIFSDYDLDGDLDLFLTGLDSLDDADPITWENIHYFIDMQENIGDQWDPIFADRTSVQNFPYPLGYFLPTGGDLNDDGKTDFISFASVDFIGNRTGAYIRNIGDNTFESIRLDAMGLPDFVPESLFFPELLDLDGDGDLDLLMSGFDSAIAEEDGDDIPVYYYAKNVGTSSAPDLLGWFDNPYGLMPIPLVETLTGGDIDNDGDMDLIGATILIPEDSMNYLYVHLNTPGTNGKPAFGSVMLSPYGLPSGFGSTQLTAPVFVDINSDGDLDLFVFISTSSSQVLSFYENNACTPEVNVIFADICEGDSYELAGNTYTKSGEYTILLTGSDGCDSTIQLILDVLPDHMVTLNESICLGETFMVGDETFTSAGDYAIFIAASNGCDSIVFLTLTVHEVDNSVTTEQNILTSNQAGASYQWIDCDSGQNIVGATAQSFVVLTTGNYAVRITDGFGCTVVSVCVSVIISGTEEDRISNAISLYPNPSDSWVHIINDTQYPVSKLTLINLYGQTIKEIVPNGNPIDISHLEQGVYFVKLEINGLEIVKKLIISD